MRTHAYDGSDGIGAEGERILDEYFNRRYQINLATVEEQRREIDRWFTDPQTGSMLSIEYKTDGKANRTGNAAIEVINNDRLMTFGWGIRCDAHWLVYYVHASTSSQRRLLALSINTLHGNVDRWIREYGRNVILTPNSGYRTWNLLIPFEELQYVSFRRDFWYLHHQPPQMYVSSAGAKPRLSNHPDQPFHRWTIQYVYNAVSSWIDPRTSERVILTARDTQPVAVVLADYQKAGWSFVGCLGPADDSRVIYIFKQHYLSNSPV